MLLGKIVFLLLGAWNLLSLWLGTWGQIWFYNPFFIQKILPFLVQTVSLSLFHLFYVRYVRILKHIEFLWSYLFFLLFESLQGFLLKRRLLYRKVFDLFCLNFFLLWRIITIFYHIFLSTKRMWCFSLQFRIFGNSHNGRRRFHSLFLRFLFQCLSQLKILIPNKFLRSTFLQPSNQILLIFFLHTLSLHHQQPS